MDVMKKRWHRYHYKNLTYLVISLIISILVFNNNYVHLFLSHLGKLKYFGAFVGGMLFVSTFSMSFGSVILINLISYMNPIVIALLAGVGAVVGDMGVFRLVQTKGIVEEVKHFFHYFGSDRLEHLIHTKYFSWSLPVIGALLIASPLPDELGVSLMGISHMKTWKFIIISFFLNSIGIFLVISAALVLQRI